jgi:carboxyl-terminal processing protease
VTPQAYADLVLELLRDRALFADRVDWTATGESVSAAAARATSPADLHPVLRTVVATAGGAHSGLAAPGGSRRTRRPQPLPTARSEGRTTVLVLPTCPGDAVSTWRYVVTGGRALRRLPSGSSWVVDLRGNGGGSMWPMLAVAAPLLGGDGVLGAFVDRQDRRTAWWLRGSRVGAGRGRAQARSRGPRRRDGPVAVLTDGRTASSGEAVAVAFRGRPGARSYGATTYGFSTGNESVRLPDGALLHLTTSRFADRTGAVHGRPRPEARPELARGEEDGVLFQRNLWVRLSIVRCTEAILTCERPPFAPASSIASCAARKVSHTLSASPSSVVPRAPTS